MKTIIKAIAGICAAASILLLALVISVQCILPEGFQIDSGEEFFVSDRVSLTESDKTGLSPKVSGKDGRLYSVKVSIIKDSRAQEVISHGERRMVVPGGSPFGIKMYTDGVLVVGMSDIQIGVDAVNPAKEAGIKIGDIITHMQDKKLERCADVRDIVSSSEGEPLNVRIKRAGETLALSVQPVRSELDNGFKAGIWVRDSSAGIGTMTYYDPETGGFAGLGHAVCDVDTGALMPLSTGEIVDVNISGVNAGQSGKPGELKGIFSGGRPIGHLKINSDSGLFGLLTAPYFGADPVPMASRQEVKPGPAVILSTVSGNKPQSFDIQIEKVNYSDISPGKNMVIRVTDQRLLAATGGIVQGMSGSPILQDGKLIGAITHVFVNDPTKGYGIFIENMDRQMKNVGSGKIAA